MVVINSIQNILQPQRGRILEASNNKKYESHTTVPFPSAIKEKNKLLTSKEDIKENIKTYYAEDKEATEFREVFPTKSPPSKPLQFSKCSKT